MRKKGKSTVNTLNSMIKNNIVRDILLNILKVVDKLLDISHICYIFAMKTIYAITIYNLILRYGYNL
jgi:hypothetical protein